MPVEENNQQSQVPDGGATAASEDSGKPVELVPGQEPPVTPQTPVSAETKDLRIVITSNDEDTLVGMQQGGCDPLFYHVKDLAGAVKSIPKLLEMARQKWATDPQYPKTTITPPAPTKPAAAAGASHTKTATAKPSASKLQDQMF
jgi:hypothetical protein